MNRRLRSNVLVVSYICAASAASAPAATVTYTLDVSVDNVFRVLATSSAGDNGGISTYGIPLLGNVLTLNHQSPTAFKLGPPNGVTGFTNLRSADVTGPMSNPLISGSQDLSTPYRVYGFGQTPGDFSGTFFPNDPTSDVAWGVPLVIATGTYNRFAGPLGFNTGSANLLANVFDNGTGNERIAATVRTEISWFPFNSAPVVSPEPPELNPNTTQGDIITTTFAATDLETPAGPFFFSNATLQSFVPLAPGATNPPFNGTVAENGDFSWNTTGFARGVYTINVRARDDGPGLPRTSAPGGSFVVTIENVPEPTILSHSLAAAFLATTFLRRRTYPKAA